MQNQKIYLNGEWDFMPVYDVESCLDLPHVIEYDPQKIRVPSSWRTTVMRVNDFTPYKLNEYPEKWNEATTGVYHRTFSVPEELADRKIFLHLDGVMQISRIYVNGKYITDWDESYLPCSVDITDDLVWDEENDLKIVVTEYESKVFQNDVKKLLSPCGSMLHHAARGLWNDVYLDIKPCIRLEDVVVRTYFRGMNLETQLTIQNDTEKHRTLHAEAVIFDGDKEVKRMIAEPFTVVGYGSQTILLEDIWEDPILWDIDNPHLYRMQITLYDGQNVLHQTNCRFGFREFWHEGIFFYLNGKRINLRGDSYHLHGAVQMTREYAENWYRMCQEHGVNFVRLHAEPYPEIYLDVADEMGMLIVDETAMYGSGHDMACADPRYIESCRRHIRRFILRDRNHPCVILWSLQNEHYCPHGSDVFRLHENEFIQIAHKLDPTRIAYLEGDKRLLPNKDTVIISDHYSQSPLQEWIDHKEKPLVVGEHSAQWCLSPIFGLSFAGFDALNDIDDTIAGVAEEEQVYIQKARREDVSGISTYNLAFYSMNSMPDEDVPLHFDSLEGPGNKPMKIPRYSLTINNGYLKEYPAYRPNPSLGYIKKAYKAVTIIPEEYNTSFYDDSTVNRTFNVYNDSRYDQNCRIAYTVSQGDVVLMEDQFTFFQPVAERYDWTITLPQVKVSTVTEMKLTAVLFHDDREMHRLEMIYKIYPAELKKTPVSNQKNVFYYGNDEAYSMISALLPGCKRLEDLGMLSRQCDMLILGPHLHRGYEDIYLSNLDRYVQTGGSLLQLEQTNLNLNFWDLNMGDFTGRGAYSAQISDPDHPVLKGLNARDMLYWHPDLAGEWPRTYINSTLTKSTGNDAVYILECGTDQTALASWNLGRNIVIKNQVELIRNFETVPQAGLLLRNLLAYFVGFTPKKMLKTGIIADEKTVDFMKKAHLNAEPAENDLHRFDMLVVEMSALPEEQGQPLAEYLKNGGQVLFLPFEKEECGKLSCILEHEVTTELIETRHVERTAACGVLRGISKADMFHYFPHKILAKQTVEIQDGTTLMRNVAGTPWHIYYIEGKQTGFANRAVPSICKNEKAPEMPYVAEVAVGNGKAVLSQLCTESDNSKLLRLYSRILSNMSAEMKSIAVVEGL